MSWNPDYRNPPDPARRRSVIRRIVEPGITSWGTTLAGLLPALFFIVQDLQRILAEKSPEEVNSAELRDIVLWITIATVGWFSRSHNVSSNKAGVE